jgi:type II secretory pathway component PulC
LEPQFAEGEIGGLKINRLAPDSVLRRMGLRPGDVITGFNEQPVTNPADAKELFEELEASGEVQVMIRRQGQQQAIDIKQ